MLAAYDQGVVWNTRANLMRNLKTTHVALVLLIGIATLFALQVSDAGQSSRSSSHFSVTVTEVIGGEDSVIIQIRIDSRPNCQVKITSDKKGGGGLSALTGGVENRPDQGVITVTILADHVEWEAGGVNAIKFRMSIHGNVPKALMSDIGPMVAGTQLKDLFVVPVKTDTYEYGTAIPVLKFKDTTYSLTVASPTSKR